MTADFIDAMPVCVRVKAGNSGISVSKVNSIHLMSESSSLVVDELVSWSAGRGATSNSDDSWTSKSRPSVCDLESNILASGEVERMEVVLCWALETSLEDFDVSMAFSGVGPEEDILDICRR